MQRGRAGLNKHRADVARIVQGRAFKAWSTHAEGPWVTRRKRHGVGEGSAKLGGLVELKEVESWVRGGSSGQRSVCSWLETECLQFLVR